MDPPSHATNSPFLEFTRPAEGVLRLTMCRPERRNALSQAAMKELLEALKAAEADGSVGCILIAAEGPVFSAGHDLKELAELQANALRGAGHDLGKGDALGALDRDQVSQVEEVFSVCGALMTHLIRSGTPSIAVVRGLATAAGCQLVASCDLAVASEHASFATPGVDIGLFCSTPSVALSRSVPKKAAMEMLLLGDRIPARRALELGLINRVVPEDEVGAVALALAKTVASKPRATVAAGKRGFSRQIEQDLESAYTSMGEAMVHGLLSEDAREGIGAFLQKRKARWNDS